ncbi:transglycosylase SLT domain-containing protein [Sorangium sp. So ce1036]|uniref:transglycosylase SLT domain-containing protein n=1 Tax=Sorangium sp. So ce1036 TaxID=3133328 RepID=UPI003F099175
MAALSGVAFSGLAAPSPEPRARAAAETTGPANRGGAAEGGAAKPAPARTSPRAASSRKGSARSVAKSPAKGTARSKAPKKNAVKRTRKPGAPGVPDEAARRIVAGTAAPAGSSVGDSPELRAMREIDRALFPGAAPSAGPAWPADGALLLGAGEPRLETSGLPPAGLTAAPVEVDETRDISWLRQLELPDIPVRFDGRVVRYLEYYKNDPRGRSAVVIWMRRSGRYGDAIRRVLREQGLPEDLLWLALVESGFDPTIHSPAGAAGLWQFMPEGARIYGLTVDRWVDERLDPERSTLAAARYLSDLRRRFGSWELAFAAYNMGYGGLLASIRKYNTNDFWELSRIEAGMPLETALYVPKIIAMALVARNRKVFGCDDVELDPPVAFDKISLGAGVSLQSVAAAAGTGSSEIEALNPQLVAKRTPPLPVGAKEQVRWEVRVPAGAGARVAKSMPKVLEREPKLERYLVRWGESLDDIAASRGTTRWTLQSLNGLRSGEPVRPGALLFVPAAEGIGAAAAEHLLANGAPRGAEARPVVVVPAQRFSYEGRRRVFYRVVAGDTLRELAAVLSVRPDEVCRWNTLAPGAALHEGMTLQLFVPRSRRYDGVSLLDEAEARVLEVGTEEFFAHFEGLKGRKRIEIAAREGDTFSKIASRYGLSVGSLERINQRSRRSELSPGDRLVVYVPATRPDEAEPVESREDEVRVASAEVAGAVDEGEKAAAQAVKPAVLRTPVASEGAGGEDGRKAAGDKDGRGKPGGAAGATSGGETKLARAEAAKAEAGGGETKPARADGAKVEAAKADAAKAEGAKAAKAGGGETKPARADGAKVEAAKAEAGAGKTTPARADAAKADGAKADGAKAGAGGGEKKPAQADGAKAGAGGEKRGDAGAGAAGSGRPAGSAPQGDKTAAAASEKKPGRGGEDEKKPGRGGEDEKKPAGHARRAEDREKPAAGAGTAL